MSQKDARPLFISDQDKDSTTVLFIKNHKDPDHLIRQINGVYSNGSLLEAASLIDCVIDSYNPLIERAELFVLQAKIEIELCGFSEKVSTALKQALILNSESKEALHLLQLVRIHQEFRDGLYTTAEEACRTLLQQNDKDPYASYLLANHLLWKNGSETEAIRLFEVAVSLRPHFLKAWLNLGMAYKKAHLFEKAEHAFVECLRIDSNPTQQDFYRSCLHSLSI